MHELLTPAQMRRADARTIEDGTPGMVLMRAAGKAVADIAARMAKENQRIVVLAGTGNNGGDGFVAAQFLKARGRKVVVALSDDRAKLRGDARSALEAWSGETVEVSAGIFAECGLVIDALFGAGLDRDVEGRPKELIQAVNRSGCQVVSVDLPSGIDGATGEVRGAAIKATETVTFFRLKPGHLLYPGRAHCGRTHLAQIGIPDTVLETVAPRCFANDPALWLDAYPFPRATGHKYDRGHALVVGGPVVRTSAARLAAGAALRAGAGLATLASPKAAILVNAAHLTAVMLRPCDDAGDLDAILDDQRLSAAVLGPGLGVGDRTRALVLSALRSGAACVLDADALTSFAGNPRILFRAAAGRRAPIVLTPHGGEFARLFPAENAMPKIEGARRAAATSGAIVVLKGADTVIAHPDGRTAINANAPPHLATAGAGDVLAGIVGGLLAQHMSAFEAASAAVWIHGDAATRSGPGMIAEDLDPALRETIAAIYARRGG